MQFAASIDVRGGRQGLDLLGGRVGVGAVKIYGMDKMCRGPFDEDFHVSGNRRGRRIVNMPEDRVKHWSRELGEIGRELIEFAVEIAEEQQRLFAQHCEA